MRTPAVHLVDDRPAPGSGGFLTPLSAPARRVTRYLCRFHGGDRIPVRFGRSGEIEVEPIQAKAISWAPERACLSVEGMTRLAAMVSTSV